MEIKLSKRFEKIVKKNERYSDEHRPKDSYMDPKLADISVSIQSHFDKLSNMKGFRQNRGEDAHDILNITKQGTAMSMSSTMKSGSKGRSPT